MRILFHCPWHNSKEWLETIKKQFKNNKIYTLNDKLDLSKIECAIIWNISNHILSKMSNVKILFSLGAGVDHQKKRPVCGGMPGKDGAGLSSGGRVLRQRGGSARVGRERMLDLFRRRMDLPQVQRGDHEKPRQNPENEGGVITRFSVHSF